ncbi:Gx transporter family protein [Deferrisoma camini]|uniref:Gx transporter family protein n=1 Tax=Deferrisoma camini TaxID=1035120 RepID=UPI00046D5CAA|nr:Gx transporter family protein [Deferrisoma camini]
MQWDAEPTARAAHMGFLIALAGALQVLELLLPTPVPWARLGLANAPVLAALALWGPGPGLWVGVGKVIVGALFTGRFLTPGFFLSAGGTLAAVAVMAAAVRVPMLGFVGVSALGAEAHLLTQLALASALLRTPAVWALVPLAGTLALASGVVTGWVTAGIVRVAQEDLGYPPATGGNRATSSPSART